MASTSAKQTMRTRTLATFVTVAALLAMSGTTTASASTAAPRPLRVDDMFHIEQIPAYFMMESDFSSDGKAFAFVRGRPRITRRTLEGGGDVGSGGNANGDVWVQLSAGAPLINVTQGLKGDAGWFRPHWSPDGRTLALMKMGRDAPTLWVWSPSGRKLKSLSPLGIHRYVWLDDRRLIAEALPAGGRWVYQRAYGKPDIAVYAPDLWAKADRGLEPTASVLSSGIPIDVTAQPQGSLILVDSVSGKVQTLARGNYGGAWSLSPSGTAVAYGKQVLATAPQADKALSLSEDEARYTIEVSNVDGKVLLSSAASSMDVMRELPRWSDNGKELYYFAHGANRSDPPALYRFRLDAQKPEAVDPGDLDPMPATGIGLAWTPEGDLIVLAAKRAGDKPAAPGSRRDWWHIRRGAAPANLTAAMSEVPASLSVVADGRGYVGVAGGHVWRVSSSEKPVDVTASFDSKITQAIWTGAERSSPPRRMPATRMLVLAPEGQRACAHLLDQAR